MTERQSHSPTSHHALRAGGNIQQVPAILQLFEPAPGFEYPLVELSREPNTFFSRRNGDDGLSGEIPANAVPSPTEKVHDGAPVVSP
jgi:hypothetical protein